MGLGANWACAMELRYAQNLMAAFELFRSRQCDKGACELLDTLTSTRANPASGSLHRDQTTSSFRPGGALVAGGGSRD